MTGCHRPILFSEGAEPLARPISHGGPVAPQHALPGTRDAYGPSLRQSDLLHVAEATAVCDGPSNFPRGQIPEFGHAPTVIVRGLAARTATIASLSLAKIDPAGLILMLPSDSMSIDHDGFEQAVSIGATVAAAGWIAALGKAVATDSVGYGSIHAGASLVSVPEAFTVERFVAEPDLNGIVECRLGRTFACSGVFVFRADVFLAEIGRYAPEIVPATAAMLSSAVMGADAIRVDAGAFEVIPDTSIARAVMEKTCRAAVIPCEIG